MPEIISRTRWRGLVALTGALSLLAAACGTGGTDGGLSADAGQADSSAPADDTTAPAESDPGAEQAVVDDSAAVPAANLFPDVDVVNVGDSSTLNLADELGGGELPVLLWFWAPH